MGTKKYYVYIMANHHLSLYIGTTNNLIKRVWDHKNDVVKAFTKKYKLKMLVYFEEYSNPLDAIAREKQLKNWKRECKLALVRKSNPAIKDLYPTLI